MLVIYVIQFFQFDLMKEENDSSFLGKLFWGYLAYKVITKPFRTRPEEIYWEEEE